MTLPSLAPWRTEDVENREYRGTGAFLEEREVVGFDAQDGRRLQHDEGRRDRETAGGDLLRGGSPGRAGRGPLQPRPVRVGGQRKTRRDGAGRPEIPGRLQAALLGRAVGDPVRAPDRGGVDASVRLRFPLLPRADAGAVPVLPAQERRGLVRAPARRGDVPDLPAAGEPA